MAHVWRRHQRVQGPAAGDGETAEVVTMGRADPADPGVGAVRAHGSTVWSSSSRA
ncbi:hypothetical protein QJS66_00100 [Kocuria rhizophila]|nr:hypothetical protein QJS66_00100 [Kocuria rhizophila]